MRGREGGRRLLLSASRRTHIREEGAVHHVWIREDDVSVIPRINAIRESCVSVTRHRPHRQRFPALAVVLDLVATTGCLSLSLSTYDRL